MFPWAQLTLSSRPAELVSCRDRHLGRVGRQSRPRHSLSWAKVPTAALAELDTSADRHVPTATFVELGASTTATFVELGASTTATFVELGAGPDRGIGGVGRDAVPTAFPFTRIISCIYVALFFSAAVSCPPACVHGPYAARFLSQWRLLPQPTSRPSPCRSRRRRSHP